MPVLASAEIASAHPPLDETDRAEVTDADSSRQIAAGHIPAAGQPLMVSNA